MDKMNILNSKLYRIDLEKASSKINIEKLRKKSVVITGGLGLIGSAITDLLIVMNGKYSADIKICVAARNKDAFLSRYGNEGVEFLQYDALGNFEPVFIPNYIIHGAGLASPELYTSSPVETMLSNVQGIFSVLEYSRKNNVSTVLYVSSSEVYGKKDTDVPFTEGIYGTIDIDNIRSSYPIAKIASEMLCKSYTAEYGVNTVIVRPGHIYGPSMKYNDKRISSEFPIKAAKNEELVMKSSGLQKRSYCYSVDAAVAVLCALTNGTFGEAYNIGHDEVTSIREMAAIVASAGNVPLSISNPTEEELKVFNPMNNSTLNNEKIKEIGYSDTFTVEDGLTHTVEILKEIL